MATTQVLETDPELLVGLIPGSSRTDHLAVLPPGSTLLLYTDGLIEHRGRFLGEGISDLRRAMAECKDCTTEDMLDHLVYELVGQTFDDDCAILALRAHPKTAHARPKPEEAAPAELPRPANPRDAPAVTG